MNAQSRLSTQHYGRNIIEVQHLRKSFGRRTVLDDVSLKVRRGETLVVLGRSGTGKSVLLKTVIGLMEPSAGKVLVLERDVHRMNEEQRLRFRRDIGYVFQNAALFDSLTVLENVGFPLYQRGVPEAQIRDTVSKRLDMVGLAHTLNQYPVELSGGMRKRVGLARAIVDLPPIVLYDEPTSGLDPLTTDVINQIILRLRAQLSVTSIVVTHDMSSAFTIADRIIMLDQGSIVVDGTPADIRESDNPWVQNFIAGRALEHERIDTKRFALPTGILPRLPGTVPTPAASTTARHVVPPSIRVRRGHEPSRRLGAKSGPQRKADSQNVAPTKDALSALPSIPSEAGEDSGLRPVDWVINLDDDNGHVLQRKPDPKKKSDDEPADT